MRPMETNEEPSILSCAWGVFSSRVSQAHAKPHAISGSYYSLYCECFSWTIGKFYRNSLPMLMQKVTADSLTRLKILSL